MAGIPLRLKGSEQAGPGTTNSNLAAGTSVYALQEMTASEIIDGVIYRMLREFARIERTTPRTGDLTLLDTVGDIATTLTGDFVDTTRVNAVGARGNVTTISAVSTSTTSIYQVLTSVSGPIVRPLCYDNGVLKEMSDLQIFQTIIEPALNRMTNRGLGSYHFSVGAPTDLNGDALPGTWTAVFSLTDRYKTGNISNTSARGFVNNTVQPPTASIATYTVAAASENTSTTYTLWRKTDETPPTSQLRPLRWANTAERGKHIVEMSNSDILSLLIPFRNAIINDGRGRYRFQETAPTSGTWARRGDNVLDILNTIGTGSYTWGYATTYTGSFTGFFTSTYTGSYTRSFTGTSTAFYGDDGFWSGGSAATFTGFYTVAIEKTFSRPESSIVNRGYVRTTLQAYTAPIVSADTLVQNNDYLWVKRSN